MLKEFKKLRQVEEISRRLFTDEYFDLYLWYKKNSEDFIGFQLVFSVNDNQMALTAEVGKYPHIRKVDSGDDQFYDPTDLLDGTGYFPQEELYEMFEKHSENLDEELRVNILKVIRTYNDKNLPSNFKSRLKLSRIY